MSINRFIWLSIWLICFTIWNNIVTIFRILWGRLINFCVDYLTEGNTNDQYKSFVQAERDSYPPPPLKVQLERSQVETIEIDSDDEEDEPPNDRHHRRCRSMPLEKMEVISISIL